MVIAILSMHLTPMSSDKKNKLTEKIHESLDLPKSEQSSNLKSQHQEPSLFQSQHQEPSINKSVLINSERRNTNLIKKVVKKQNIKKNKKEQFIQARRVKYDDSD